MRSRSMPIETYLDRDAAIATHHSVSCVIDPNHPGGQHGARSAPGGITTNPAPARRRARRAQSRPAANSRWRRRAVWATALHSTEGKDAGVGVGCSSRRQQTADTPAGSIFRQEDGNGASTTQYLSGYRWRQPAFAQPEVAHQAKPRQQGARQNHQQRNTLARTGRPPRCQRLCPYATGLKRGL